MRKSWNWVWQQSKLRPISYVEKRGRFYVFCEKTDPSVEYLVTTWGTLTSRPLR